MVDNTNPTNQFHPYQPATATPHTEVSRSGLGGILDRIGVSGGNLGGSLRNVDVRGGVDRMRGYAQRNPSKVLGGLAALAIGLGMMRGRGMRTR
jgi:hypothetical protein